MRKFFKKGNEVFELAQDGSQDHVLTDEYVKMTEDEIDRHLYPEKYMTNEEKRMLYLKSLAPLTRRQFKLILSERGFLDRVATALNQITDPQLKAQATIEWEDSATFERLNPTLLLLYPLMGLKEAEVDKLWEAGLKL